MTKQHILITGSRKGIGRALSEYYLKKGDKVIGCSRDISDLEHERYLHFQADVSDEKSVVQTVRKAAKEVGRIDVLINNAGTAVMNHVLTTPTSAVRRIFDVNMLGTFLFTRETAKIMRRVKYGRIVNLATVATPLRLEGEACYAASKAAVVNFTQTSAKELAPYGITVNAVGPTPIHTDLVKAVPKAKIDELFKRQAIPRFGEMDDVINAVDFFIDSRSAFITGQVLYLGGVCG